MIGREVSHYRILDEIGRGGMGVVYRAEDTRLKRPVALKFLPADVLGDEDARARFVQEAQAASSLQHPNICTIHDIETPSDGGPFIVMDYYAGQSLTKMIARGPMSAEQARGIVRQIGLGLKAAHDRGIIHRDIKPANVLVGPDGTARILDFGLAKLSGARTRLTRAGATIGTAAYMSPEQCRGEEVDHRTDIWSLGVVLYEMLTGKLPFGGEYENAIIYAILNSPCKPAREQGADVSPDLNLLIEKSLAKNREQRYQGIDEFLADLDHTSESAERPEGVRRGQAIAIPVQRRRRRWVWIAGVLVIVSAIALLVLGPLFRGSVGAGAPPPIAVITFVNQTGDPSLDYLQEAIPNLLITSLEQSSDLQVITWERMRDVLRQLGKADRTFIDADLGFEFCRHEGIQTIVLGSYVRAGEMFVTDAKVLDVETKELLKSTSARGEGIRSILAGQIDDLSSAIVRSIGSAQQEIEPSPVRISEVTTSSMDAYSYFLRGREEVENINHSGARTYLERAIELDSTFAMAYLYLSIACEYLMEPSAAVHAIERARALSSRAPEKERLLIEASYADLVERDYPRRVALYEELVRKYPLEKRFHAYLGVNYFLMNLLPDAEREVKRALQLDPEYGFAMNTLGYVYAEQGRLEEALEAFQEYTTLAPGDANPFDSMGELYLRMGRLDEAIGRYREAVRVQPSFFGAYRGLAYVFAAREDYDSCLEVVDSLRRVAPSPAMKVEALAWKVVYLNRLGRFRESDLAIQEMSGLVKALPRAGATLHWTRAWAEVSRGALHSARTSFLRLHTALSEGNPQRPQTADAIRDIGLGYLCAVSGELDSAAVRVSRVRAEIPTLSRRIGRDVEMLAGLLEAEILLRSGAADSAVRVCRNTPVPGTYWGGEWYMKLYNVPPERDIVARAFSEKGDLDSAITEYERLLTVEPGNSDRRLSHPLYRFRLATLYERTGRKGMAKAEYRRFLEIWRNADEDRPELTESRKRMAGLAQAE